MGFCVSTKSLSQHGKGWKWIGKNTVENKVNNKNYRVLFAKIMMDEKSYDQLSYKL